MTNARHALDRPSSENPSAEFGADGPDFVAETRAKLDAWLHGLKLTPAELPPELARTTTEKGGSATEHLTRAFTSPDHAWLRLSEIFHERGTLIVNLAAFPEGHSYLPLIQAEVVIVRSRVVLAIYDLHDLLEVAGPDPSSESPASFCRGLRRRFGAALPQVSERPDWTRGVVSDAALWSRPMTAEAVAPALAALDEFLDACATAMERSKAAGYPRRSPAAALEVRQRVARARSQSLAGNPSKRFLETTFGKEWSARFVEDVLYPASLAT